MQHHILEVETLYPSFKFQLFDLGVKFLLNDLLMLEVDLSSVLQVLVVASKLAEGEVLAMLVIYLFHELWIAGAEVDELVLSVE